MGVKESAHTDNMGRLAPQDEGTKRSTWKDPAIGQGSLRPVQGGGVIVMSHLCSNGVIRAEHHEGVSFKG